MAVTLYDPCGADAARARQGVTVTTSGDADRSRWRSKGSGRSSRALMSYSTTATCRGSIRSHTVCPTACVSSGGAAARSRNPVPFGCST